MHFQTLLSPFTRIKKSLFGESRIKKIKLLQETSDFLNLRHNSVISAIISLEEHEKELFSEGKKSNQLSTKRRIAGMISLLRKDIQRQKDIASIVSQQITLTHSQIHNEVILAQCEAVPLPNADEIISRATEAQMAVEELSASATNIHSVEVPSNYSDDELSILKELECSEVQQPQFVVGEETESAIYFKQKEKELA